MIFFYFNKYFKFKEVSQIIIFLYAKSVSDIISALFSHVKMKHCRIQNQKVQIFKYPNAESHKIVEAAEAVFIALYRSDPSENLDVLR